MSIEDKEKIGFQERSIDEILEHFAADIPHEGQYNHYGHDAAPNTRMGSAEFGGGDHMNVNGLYYQDAYPSHGRSSLPFIFNTREDVLPTMVDVGGGNFMVYGTPTSQKNHLPNLMKKTNGNLTGYNDYGMEYSGADYNLFSANSPPQHQNMPPFLQQQGTVPKAQLIENLVGNWTSDHSGTYSPFGSCVGHVRNPNTDVRDERTKQKPRMVAEVRPMRPSYSDVLTKSINHNTTTVPTQKPGNKNIQEVKQRATEPKLAKNNKTAGRTLSGSGNGLNRQHSAALDDESFMGLRNTGLKKVEPGPQDGLSKKWLSLDDLTDTRQGDYISIGKKSSPKPTARSQNKWGDRENGTPNNAKPGSATNTRQPGVKDKAKVKEKGSKEREPKPESGRKAEERRPGRESKPEGHKAANRRNSRQAAEKHGGKTTGRGRRRDQEPYLATLMKLQLDHYGGFLLRALQWLFRLVADVCGMSAHLALHMLTAVWVSTVSRTVDMQARLVEAVRNIEVLKWIAASRFWPFKSKRQRIDSGSEEEDPGGGGTGKTKNKLPKGLKKNLPLPVTGEEAMKRLLACKGKDPYSILGVTHNCTDDDIKKYYKRQAFLVHPDKNNQPGAEESFKILVHAFDIIGEPEHRKLYDRRVEKTHQVEQAWSELSELLSKLRSKMEHVANTIRCTNCGKRHKKGLVNRPMYAARMCAQCRIHHPAREGDIWAETTMFGMMWRYYACMDGAVYDVTEWAGCQGGNLRNLKAYTHNVQYRIVLDKQRGQKQKYQHPTPTSEPDLEDFISNLYTKSDATGDAEADSSAARKRKSKRKK